jgi:RHS repeat-associated protein
MYFQETPRYGQYTYDVLVGKFITLSNQFKDVFVLSEWHIYGSSRLGIQKPVSKDSHAVPNFVGIASAGTGRELVHIEFNGSWSSYEINYADTSNTTVTTYQMSYEYYSLTRGEKNYELSNHLGSVLVTVSDKKLPVCSADVVTHYTADVLAAYDYYAGSGRIMPGRIFEAQAYRFGAQGSEVDAEIGDDRNYITTFHREADLELMQWITPDPETAQRPWQSPYVYMGNNPILNTDPMGDLEGDYYGSDGKYLGTDGIDDKKVYTTTETAVNENKGADGNIKTDIQ